MFALSKEAKVLSIFSSFALIGLIACGFLLSKLETQLGEFGQRVNLFSYTPRLSGGSPAHDWSIGRTESKSFFII